MSYTRPHRTHHRPAPGNIVTALRKQYPDVYTSLIEGYRPLKYDFKLIDTLWQADADRILFFGAIILLYGRYAPNGTLHTDLHTGVSAYIYRLTGMQPPNIYEYVAQAKVYFKTTGFQEKVEQFIYEVTGMVL